MVRFSKSAVQLYEQNGLYSIMLVKTAHKNDPKGQLGSPARGKWEAATTTVSG